MPSQRRLSRCSMPTWTCPQGWRVHRTHASADVLCAQLMHDLFVIAKFLVGLFVEISPHAFLSCITDTVRYRYRWYSNFIHLGRVWLKSNTRHQWALAICCDENLMGARRTSCKGRKNPPTPFPLHPPPFHCLLSHLSSSFPSALCHIPSLGPIYCPSFSTAKRPPH